MVIETFAEVTGIVDVKYLLFCKFLIFSIFFWYFLTSCRALIWSSMVQRPDFGWKVFKSSFLLGILLMFSKFSFGGMMSFCLIWGTWMALTFRNSCLVSSISASRYLSSSGGMPNIFSSGFCLMYLLPISRSSSSSSPSSKPIDISVIF